MNGNTHILVVEDDNDISGLLCSIVRRSGYTAQPAFSGTEALLYLKQQPWDMVLLDLMLPGLSGEEVLNEAREHGAPPVMIISAKGDQSRKIAALRGGADDYITKPFDIEEVSARIDSHLRRVHRAANSAKPVIYSHKNLLLDPEAKTVHADGEPISLTAREFDILHLLMASPKKVFSKSNLYESIWGEEFLGDDNTVNVHMSNLRSKLAKACPGEEWIETVWGIGYRLKP
ncbi:response regulator transcription factor [Paenibacillus favisporus]|uniref:response regulator transcription factor n=1 Tax=Paenibacillus TaxID=44249 RepID=UPI00119D611C|nr:MULTISPECIES: response regulator transcription factor [Paenibacillus]MEC0178718.1 response regulator transcription factor [Paenibacillus favisporus]